MNTSQAFRSHPILFLLGGFLTALVTVGLMLAIGLPLGFRGEHIGRLAAPVIFFNFIPGCVGFVNLVIDKTYRNWKVGSPLLRLNTPTKRMWFMLVPVGLISAVASYFVYGSWNFVSHIRSSYWMSMEGHYFVSFIMFWLGFYGVIFGVIFSFAYDSTLGKLVGWIRGR